MSCLLILMHNLCPLVSWCWCQWRCMDLVNVPMPSVLEGLMFSLGALQVICICNSHLWQTYRIHGICKVPNLISSDTSHYYNHAFCAWRNIISFFIQHSLDEIVHLINKEQTNKAELKWSTKEKRCKLSFYMTMCSNLGKFNITLFLIYAYLWKARHGFFNARMHFPYSWEVSRLPFMVIQLSPFWVLLFSLHSLQLIPWLWQAS